MQAFSYSEDLKIGLKTRLEDDFYLMKFICKGGQGMIFIPGKSCDRILEGWKSFWIYAKEQKLQDILE